MSPRKKRSRPHVRIGAPLSGEPQPGLQWIEVASFLQIPGFQVIGLPAPEVAEARERIRAAIGASDLEFPRRRVILNLSPASVRKRGTGADLAMALAVLREADGPASAESGQPETSVIAWGELGLDGSIKAAGALTFALYAAWEAGADALIVAADEFGAAQERMATLRLSNLIRDKAPPCVLPARNLREAWELLQTLPKEVPDTAWIPATSTLPDAPPDVRELLPMSASLERLLGIASSGAHHLLLLGPRGTGKSHALEWLIALQPVPSAQTRVQQALLQELSGIRSFGKTPVRRISPHVRAPALLGWAAPWGVRPGEFSLAHGGLLLADEFPEWPRDAREALREPLERGRITLTRARQSVELPARFVLAANGNLCPCGGWPPDLPRPLSAANQKIAACTCSPRSRHLYLSRLSGPILDRLDLVVLTAHSSPPPSQATAEQRMSDLRQRIQAARQASIRSWGEVPAQLPPSRLEEMLRQNPGWAEALEPSSFASLRNRHKTLRVALSLASWDGLDAPTRSTFAEALCYRPERFGLSA